MSTYISSKSASKNMYLNSQSSMASISESFKANPTSLNHIIPLDFSNVHLLPDSHKWTRNSPNDASHEPPPAIPIIDLTHPHALSLVKKASEEWGMFQVTNHGIPIKLLHQLEHQTRDLFALPAARKLLAVRSPEGFTGYGLARFSTFFSKQMWYEGFTVMGSPAHHAAKLWAAPHGRTEFCNVMEEYQKEMIGLTERLLGLMFNSLGLALEDLKWFKPRPNSGSKQPQAVLQLNSYPICPDPNHAMGLAPHTDSSLLTLLYQSNSTGLQVLVEDVGWVPVHPCNDALVVNVGDLMHIISNGRFKSALHRAVVNDTCHRVSIAHFYGPPRDIKISPPVKLVDFDHPVLYRPVSWKEYLDAKATHFTQALELIKYNVTSFSAQ